MEYEPQINTTGGIKLEEKQSKGEITLSDVKFAYPSKKDIEVLKGINLDIKHNKVVAIVGPSGKLYFYCNTWLGCGKSSLISMIERFYDPKEGKVLFDGVDIKTLEPQWYHQQVAIVSQEPVLFSGTIGENISYGLKENEVT